MCVCSNGWYVVSLYGYSYGSCTAMISAWMTSGFARKSAITTSLERCVLYWRMVNGVLFMSLANGAFPGELTGPSLIPNVCSVREPNRWCCHCEINLIVEGALVLASCAWCAYRWCTEIEHRVLLAGSLLWLSSTCSRAVIADLR